MCELLPAGALREQVLAEVAQAGGVTGEQLRALWGAAITAGVPHAGPQPTPNPASRRTPLARNATTLLDRAVWLLLQRCNLWEQIGAEDHEHLAAQPAPYGDFFALLDRCMHDHGVLSRAGLLDSLRSAAAEDAALRDLLERSATLHDLGDDVDALADLRAVLLRLQLQQVKDELTLLIESGEQSRDTVARRDLLIARHRELSAAMAGVDVRPALPLGRRL